MKIISYNVNGIRAALSKNFTEWLQSENPDIICLSDTCGSLELSEFDTLMRQIRKSGISMSKIGWHLHVPQFREIVARQMVAGGLLYGVRHFDVSMLDSGGCSVTMNKNQLNPNLSYEIFYEALVTYIMNIDKYKSTTMNDHLFNISFHGV